MSGRKGAKWKSNASRKRMSKIMKGNRHQEKKRSKKTKDKIAKALKGNKHTFGYKHSKGMKLKCRIAKMGDKNSAWQGGISFEPYSPDWKKEIKDKIKERDNHTCQRCGLSYRKLHVHHIDYNKKNCLPENLITLCHNCHSESNHNREYWQKHLKEFINGQFRKVLIDVR